MLLTYKIKVVNEATCNSKTESLFPHIHSGYFYSASSSPPLPTDTLPTQDECCVGVSRRRATGVDTWRSERDSNPRPFGRKVSNLPMIHPDPQTFLFLCVIHLCITTHPYRRCYA